MRPNRILVALLSAIIFAGSFIYLTETALASSELTSPWAGKKYSHDQWFRVLIQVGNNKEELIDTNWRPVFDKEQVLGSGYTADTAAKIESNQALAYYLKTAEMYHEEKNMYILSAAGAREINVGNNYVKGSNWTKNIPIKSTPSEVEIKERVGALVSKDPSASKNKPSIRYNKPPSSVVWDGEKFHYALSTSLVDGEKRGICNLQKDCFTHNAFVNPEVPEVGYGELHLKFPYDTRFTSLAPVIFTDTKANQKATGQIHVVNLAPWTTIADYTKFRVYTWAEGDPTPKLQGTSQNLKLNTMEPKPVAFEFVVPEKPFRLILTVNMHYINGWQNENLYTAFDHNGKPHVAMEEEYAMNKVEVPYFPSTLPPPQDPQPQANLAITELQMYSDGKPVGGTVESGKNYQIKAKYTSTFDKGGFATIRLYVKRQSGDMEFKEQKSIYFEPKATYTHDWGNWPAYSEQVTYISTIAYRWWAQQNKWDKELFNLTDEEITYTDNKKEIQVTGTDKPREAPEPIGYGFPLYYPTQIEGRYEIIEEIEHEKEIIEWHEVPFTPVEVEGRVKAVIID